MVGTPIIQIKNAFELFIQIVNEFINSKLDNYLKILITSIYIRSADD